LHIMSRDFSKMLRRLAAYRSSSSHRSDSRRGRFVGRMEKLEPRVLLAFNPSPLEQAVLEDINRMRTDPQGELDVFFVQTRPLIARNADVQSAVNFFRVNGATLLSQWSDLEPVSPVAWNESLYDAALAHNHVMIEFDEQAHVLEGEASIGDRVTDAGYQNGSIVLENVYAFGKSTEQAHAGFLIDWGDTPSGIQDPPGHRRNMMHPLVEEVGAAIVFENDSQTGVGPMILTQDFGGRRDYIPQVLGVVYDDRDADGAYDAGEGLGGVQIEVVGQMETFRTTTMSAGGYQLPVPNGTYEIYASGSRLSQPVSVAGVVMAGANVKVDLNLEDALRPPTALSDSRNTTEDVPVDVDVLANDSDADGVLDRSSVRITEFPKRGTVEIDVSTGQIRYQPTANFSGSDSFKYRVRDDDGAISNEATVRLFVGNVNDIPVARNDIFVTNEDSPLELGVLQNDSDVDGALNPATIQIIRPPAHGDVVLNARSGKVTFVPQPNFSGSDSFSYAVQDDSAAISNTATAFITVIDVNDAPQAVDDRSVTWEETSVAVPVLANDVDIDGVVEPNAVGLTRFPDHGSVSLDRATGVVTYTPESGFFGSDTFAYAALDDDLGLSNQAIVSVMVTEKGYPWRNPVNPLDIDNDRVVGPLDALTVIRDILDNFARRLPIPNRPGDAAPPFLDSNRDGLVSAIDALLVIREFSDPQAPGLDANALGGPADPTFRATLSASAENPAAFAGGHTQQAPELSPLVNPLAPASANASRPQSSVPDSLDPTGDGTIASQKAKALPRIPWQAERPEPASGRRSPRADIAADAAFTLEEVISLIAADVCRVLA
jgi:uncharacterized protein YkwD